MRGLLVICDQDSATYELTLAGRSALWDYTKAQGIEPPLSTQRDVAALRSAVKDVKRAALSDSNDDEIDVLQEALDLALVRVPKEQAATIRAQLEELAAGNSNDEEIDGSHEALSEALHYWPEINVEAIEEEVEAAQIETLHTAPGPVPPP